MIIKYIIYTLFGFYLLIKGADLFVDGIASTANNLKIPKIIISLSIVAFGTSAPELFISFKSLLSGNNDIVYANIVGSTIVNSMLVLGIASMIKPMRIKSETIKKQLPIHFAIILFFSILLLDRTFNNTINIITRNDALILFVTFIYFLLYIIKFNKTQDKEKIIEKPIWPLPKSIIISIISLIAIAIGSDLAVDSCVAIANYLNVSEKVITMIILVIGTSTPELIMAITSVKKGEFDIIIGDIIGTNIFNIGFVLTLPIIIFGGVYTTTFNFIDMFIMTLSGLVLYIFSKDDRKIDKTEGIIMLSIFIIYYTYILILE